MSGNPNPIPPFVAGAILAGIAWGVVILLLIGGGLLVVAYP
jgi:hypothetical protein